ncbi:AMP-binding protein [Methylobacterium sp. WSM2598]|uniref:AMP-binding protein n=1 Tax=Methylobacterium sp. WSM2598 TaxID=398261 RepID=UPI00039E5D5B|nr:AMP-binding protein [Methylobacterium sp. WSM2598]
MGSSNSKTISRPRVLALHGYGSNSTVTRMQLENLRVTSSDFDILYVNGPIAVEEAGPGIADLGDLVSGPWYSWLPSDHPGAVDGRVLLGAICDAVQTVLLQIEEYGPFDGIYGFSQGGVIASLVNGLAHDDALISALRDRTGRDPSHGLQGRMPARGMVAACAGASIPFPDLRMRAGLGAGPSVVSGTRCVHLIGRNDDLKSWSESLALTTDPRRTSVFYLRGGHEIGRAERDDTEICDNVRRCLAGEETGSGEPDGSEAIAWRMSSARSFRSVATDVQVAAVRSDTDGLPDTIAGMLAARPAEAPLLRWARGSDPSVHTTYGQFLDFCRPGGDGDLRRIGVRAGDVVAYLAPPGGSATAAAAFLSIASQTCAVPLTPSMSEADATQALDSCGVAHVVTFDGVSSPGVSAAIDGFVRAGKATLHRAVASTASPGLFRYAETRGDFEHLPVLANPPEAVCILLRTSGSTSVPKLVPLRQRDLVLNAALLADGLGITASDVTYSVMPLDHIGGLSASVLCSIAVGASITCDGAYTPRGMVEALLHSNPKPTWYSAVPTIHNATTRYLLDNRAIYLDRDGKLRDHHLRFIRSGAAALKEPDRAALEATFGCEVVATYSMSEQMPICQPPRTGQGWQQKPDSVGVPIVASMAVVDPATLRPVPFGVTGEVAISGPTVFAGYSDNPPANRQSRFLLRSHEDHVLRSWLLTGDLGEMDPDGTLALRGRIKELIKRGGEQVSPFDVEAVLSRHPWVGTAVCFPVPSDLYGEEVGCAVVLASSAPGNITQAEAIRELREFLRSNALAVFKYPTRWKLVEEHQLPRTTTQKYIRNGLADALGVSDSEPARPLTSEAGGGVRRSDGSSRTGAAPQVDWSTLSGLRFLLACYVMFMHIGSDQSWGAFANLRQFPWHVHAFFVVAGFSLAGSMPAPIQRKAAFVRARILAMYPLYALALLLAVVNLLPSCQPGTFSSVFHWNALSGDVSRTFCEGTPLLQSSWIANFSSTLLIYGLGLSATPLWTASWFLGFYLWFISMYFQCLIIFPFIYNLFYVRRGMTRHLLLIAGVVVGINLFILLAFWYGYATDAIGYPFFDQSTGTKISPDASQIQMAGTDNLIMLGFYLFAPFWMLYFVGGICVAFLYDAVRPHEQRHSVIWGYVADAITALIILYSAAHVMQGYIPHGPELSRASLETFFLRPDAADSFMDPGIVNRTWDEINSRVWAPVTLLWLFALSTGRGLTARILRSDPLSQTLAPTAYACFLFHQMVGQWYFALTRHGEWWNWWSYRKEFYWFSPQPVPVQWFEYFYVVGLVVIFGKLVQPLESVIRRGFGASLRLLTGESAAGRPERDTLATILDMVSRTSGLAAKPEWSLQECGLASLSVVQFTATLEAEFSTAKQKLTLSPSDLIAAQTIREIAMIVDAARSETPRPTMPALRAA